MMQRVRLPVYLTLFFFQTERFTFCRHGQLDYLLGTSSSPMVTAFWLLISARTRFDQRKRSESGKVDIELAD